MAIGSPVATGRGKRRQHGSPERRAEALKRITALFLDGAPRFNDDHVRLFDEVFNCLINEIETKARSELSHRLAPVGNAPVEVVRRLAHDDDIAVAGPVLKQSPRLAEGDSTKVFVVPSELSQALGGIGQALTEGAARVEKKPPVRGPRAVEPPRAEES